MMVWSAQTVAAFTTALGGLVIAIISYVGKQRSDRKLVKLNEQVDASKAERDYEYEAKKRLYAEFQPLLFQLVESCDNAYWRIHGLARSSREGRLGPDQLSRLRADSQNYLPSTVYRFMAPLVLFRLCQTRLTVVDLSVDPQIHRQYAIAKVLYRTWNGGPNLAELGHRIKYDPLRRADKLPMTMTDPVVQAKQHLNLQEIEQMIEVLTKEDKSTHMFRCMTYGEFTDACRDESSKAYKYISRVRRLFVDFRPDTRPVLWRILITQAHLYRVLMNTFNGKTDVPIDPLTIFTSEQQRNFDWRRHDTELGFEQAVKEPFAAARQYLAQRLDRLPSVQETRDVRSVQPASADGLMTHEPNTQHPTANIQDR